MNDPITLSSGITYDRSSLEGYHSSQGKPLTFPCPMSKKAISFKEISYCNTNDFIQKVIDLFVTAVEKQLPITAEMTLVQYIGVSGVNISCPLSGKAMSDPITPLSGLTCNRDSLRKLFNKPEQKIAHYQNSQGTMQYSIANVELSYGTDVTAKEIVSLVTSELAMQISVTQDDKGSVTIDHASCVRPSPEELRTARAGFFSDRDNTTNDSALGIQPPLR